MQPLFYTSIVIFALYITYSATGNVPPPQCQLGAPDPNFDCSAVVAPGEDCSSPTNCLYPNPNNCSRFYQCSNGQAYCLECAGSWPDRPLYFSPKTNQCEYQPQDYQCYQTPIEPVDPPHEDPPATPPPTEPPQQGPIPETTTPESDEDAPPASTTDSGDTTTEEDTTTPEPDEAPPADTTTGEPDTTTEEDTTTPEPDEAPPADTTTGEPDTTTAEPDTTTPAPDEAPPATETTTPEPETTTGEPDTTTPQENDAPTGPDTTTGEPDTTTGEPDTTTPEEPDAPPAPDTTTPDPPEENPPVTKPTTTRPPTTTTRPPATNTTPVCESPQAQYEIVRGCPRPRYCMFTNPYSCRSFIQCQDNQPNPIENVMPCANQVVDGNLVPLYWDDNTLTCEVRSSTCQNPNLLLNIASILFKV